MLSSSIINSIHSSICGLNSFGNGLVRIGLIWYAPHGIDTIGLSIAEFWAACPTEHRTLYSADGSEWYDVATIITNIEASAELNNGGELVGSATKGYAQFADGTAESVLLRAYSYLGENYAPATFGEMINQPLETPIISRWCYPTVSLGDYYTEEFTPQTVEVGDVDIESNVIGVNTQGETLDIYVSTGGSYSVDSGAWATDGVGSPASIIGSHLIKVKGDAAGSGQTNTVVLTVGEATYNFAITSEVVVTQIKDLWNGFSLDGFTTTYPPAVPDEGGVIRTTSGNNLAIESGKYNAGAWELPTTPPTSKSIVTLAGTRTLYNEADPTVFKRTCIAPLRTQYFKTPQTPATHTTESLATGTYVLWCRGDNGSTVTASAGTAIGTFGAATANGATHGYGTPVTITIATAGTVVLTCAGTLTWGQLEKATYTYPTPDIPNGTTTTVRNPTTLADSSADWFDVVSGEAQNFAIFSQFIMRGLDNNAKIWETKIDATNYTNLLTANGSFYLKKYAGSNLNIYFSPGTVLNMPLRVLCIFTDQGMSVRTQRFTGGAWSAWSAWTDLANTVPAKIGSTIGFGTDANPYVNHQTFATFKLTEAAALADYKTEISALVTEMLS